MSSSLNFALSKSFPTTLEVSPEAFSFMRSPKLFSMPWDMVVFLSITGVGFGFSMQKLRSTPVGEPDSESSKTIQSSIDPDSSRAELSLLDLGCVENKLNREKVTSHAGQVRLKGKFCSLNNRNMRNFGGVRVRNLTTGREGTIFLRGHDTVFVTDSLGLEPGRNEIQVEWRSSPNAAPKELIAEVYDK